MLSVPALPSYALTLAREAPARKLVTKPFLEHSVAIPGVLLHNPEHPGPRLLWHAQFVWTKFFRLVRALLHVACIVLGIATQ